MVLFVLSLRVASANRAVLRLQLTPGGYLRRAGEERAPPPSYHRRPVEDREGGAPRIGATRSGSGGMTRHPSGLYVPSRQGSTALAGRSALALEAQGRSHSGQGASLLCGRQPAPSLSTATPALHNHGRAWCLATQSCELWRVKHSTRPLRPEWSLEEVSRRGDQCQGQESGGGERVVSLCHELVV